MRARLRLLPIMIFAATCLLSIKVIDLTDSVFVHIPSIDVGQTMAAENEVDDGSAEAVGSDHADGMTGAAMEHADAASTPSEGVAADVGSGMSHMDDESTMVEGDGHDGDETLAMPVADGPASSVVLALGDEQPYQTPPLPIGDREFITESSTSPVFTAEELAVLQALAERRDLLEEREASVEARERQLDVAEQRIDQKIAELIDLRARIESLLIEYDEQEEEQLLSLVRIYETMKPKDAAPIFDQLDMEILLEIIARMSNIRSAPVLARMDPLRAQEVTEELARRLQQRPEFMEEAPVAN